MASTVPDDVQGGFSALYDLLHTVEIGEFYQDYDESTALLGRAQTGFEAIRNFVAEQPDLRLFENLLYCINAEPRLFRWNAGIIEWALPSPPYLWHALPGQDD